MFRETEYETLNLSLTRQGGYKPKRSKPTQLQRESFQVYQRFQPGITLVNCTGNLGSLLSRSLQAENLLINYDIKPIITKHIFFRNSLVHRQITDDRG